MHAWSAIASSMRSRGALEESTAIYRRVLAWSRVANGEDDLMTLSYTNNLGNVLKERGVLVEAEPLLNAAMAACSRTLGAEHDLTMSVMRNVSSLYLAWERPDEAAPLCQRAMEACLRRHGERHPDTLRCIRNMSVVLDMRGDQEARERMIRRGMAAGDDSPSAHLNLAECLLRRGDVAGAAPHLAAGTEGAHRLFGPNSPVSLHALKLRGTSQARSGDLKGAVRTVREAYAGMCAASGSRNRETRDCALLLRELEQGRGRGASAAKYDRKGAMRACSAPGCEHGDADGSKLQACSRCRQALYCCQEHQAADWAAHCGPCKAARAAAAADA